MTLLNCLLSAWNSCLLALLRTRFRRNLKSRSPEEFSGVPYSMTLPNCLLCAWYGLPFVSPHNILVSIINFAGATMETIYVLIFIVFAPKKGRNKILILFGLVLTVFAVVVLVSLLALHGQARKLFCGLAATIFSICMYASPFSIMRLVIRRKRVEHLPFFLSLFVFLCGATWFIYGLGHDLLVMVPNGFGCGPGALQWIPNAIYSNHNKTVGTKAATTTAADVDDDEDDAKTPEKDYGKPDQVDSTLTTPPEEQV